MDNINLRGSHCFKILNIMLTKKSARLRPTSLPQYPHNIGQHDHVKICKVDGPYLIAYCCLLSCTSQTRNFEDFCALANFIYI